MLMSALLAALRGLQRSQCQMLEDCLALVLKLTRRHVRAHVTDTVPAQTELSASEVPSNSSAGGNNGLAPDTLPAAGEAVEHGCQTKSDYHDVSHAFQGAQVQFANSFAAFVTALPSILEQWPETVQNRAAAKLRAFSYQCCACTAQISIAADASVLCGLALHQRRAIFGRLPSATKPAAAAQSLLEAAAAALREPGSQSGQASSAEEEELETGALLQAEEGVALGKHLLTHAALVREGMGTPLQAQSDPSDLLSQAERSTPYLLDAAGQVRVRAVPLLMPAPFPTL